MADILEFTGTLYDYRTNVEELTTALDGLDKSSQEYANTLQQLQQLNSEWTVNVSDSKEKIDELKTGVNETAESAKTDMGTLLTAFTGVIPGLNSLFVMWKNFQTTMMTNPWIAVITAALTALIILFNRIKSVISSNEETSMKWKKAMATLQPVINAIKNAIDWLVTALVDAFSWIMEKLPTVTRFIGDNTKRTLDFIATILDAVTWIPRQLASVFQKVLPMIEKGIKAILSPIKYMLEAVGLDDWVRSIDNAILKASSTMMNFASGVENGLKAPGNTVRSLGKTISSAMNNSAAAMEYSRKLQQQQNEIDKDTRETQEGLAESYGKSAEARAAYNKAMSEGNTAEAQKQMKIIQDEINKRVEMQTNLEKKRLDYMERMAELTANSKKDNDDISRQRVRLINVETQGQTELAKAYRLNARLQRQINKAIADGDKSREKSLRGEQKQAEKRQKAAEKAYKAELAAAEKAAAKASKEAQKKSDEIVKLSHENIKSYEEEFKEFDKLEQSKLKLLESLHIKRKEDDLKYENARYENEMNMYKKQFDEYMKIVDDANTLEAEKNKARADLNALEIQRMTAEVQHDINIAKIDADNLKKLTDELENKTKLLESRSKTDATNMLIENTKELNRLYANGEISAKDYLNSLKDLKQQHEDDITAIEIDAAKERANNARTVYDEYINNLKTRLGSDGNEDLFSQLTADPTQLDDNMKKLAEQLRINLDELLGLWNNFYMNKAEADKRAADNEQQQNELTAKARIENTNKQIKAIDKVLNQASKTMSAVSNFWEQSIEQRLEAGEISKEQAEEEFERLKKFNIAQAVVSTLSGALSAYMSVWKEASLPLWSKIVMSVLLGAQTLASGYAQIREIQAQTLSNAGVGGSATNVIVGAATPILNEAQDINSLNAMSAATESATSDTRVYVVESDITDAQNRTRVRVQESTF